MRLYTLIACVFILAALGGCMHTQHVEHRSMTTTGVDSTGTLSSTQQVVQDERQWRGPWFTQPDRARP